MSIVGREREQARILRQLDQCHDRGGALILEGAAGIGKSTLLSLARRVAAARGMLVMTAAAGQSETHLPFAGLHQLLRPVLARIADLPAPQREALQAAFGMRHGTAPAPFLIALGVLALLGDAATGAPLLLRIDDAHWLDRPTAEALAFVGRRVEADPIVLMVAIREGYESPLRDAGLPELHLGGLADAAARRLLDERFPELTEPARARLLDEAQGNPLALLELAAAFPLDGQQVLPAPLPLTVRLERAFAARAAELQSTTRTLLLAAAAEQNNVVATTLAAAQLVDGVPRTMEDLAPAARAKLIEIDGQTVRFRHPLVPSALYRTASAAERQAVHRALAELFAEEPERRAWHRAAAVVGPDRAVASELEEVGRRALGRGAVTTAAAAFERAAALTRDPAQRGRVLLAAAAAAGELGRGATVTRLLRETESLDLGPLERARWMAIEDGFHEAPVSSPARVRELVATASGVAAAGDADLALDLLIAAASRCYWGNLREESRDVLALADAVPAPAGDQRPLFVQAFAAPIERGAAVLSEVNRTQPLDDPSALYLRGMAVCLTGAFGHALPILGAAAQRLREQGRLPMLAQVLSIRAWAALEVADFAVAIPAADEASRLSSESPRALWQTGALIAQATLAALRGDRDAVDTLTLRAESIALPAGAAALLSLVRYARGLQELGLGRHPEAYEQLRRISDPADPACHDLTACHTIGDFAEAAARSGRAEVAWALLRELEPRARLTPSAWVHAQLELARVQLAGDDEGVFERALARDLTGLPMIRARIDLSYGEWLRRRRRRRESRAPLRAARDAFDALGASPWAERARRELRASGETSRRRQPDSLDELTPQELQIVQMAARGLSNRDIAERLYLSHRTVESHLYRVFPKLGVTSRAQLAGALGDRLGDPA